jgi:hypothetical protein
MKRTKETKKLSRALEDRARIAARRNEGWDAAPHSMIARELSLTMEELSTIRKLHRELEHALLKEECKLGTALLQQQEFNTRNRLCSQLTAVHAEQRRLTMLEQERITALQRHLLALLEKYQTLMFDED